MAAEENSSIFEELQTREAKSVASGGEAARNWLDGPRHIPLSESLDRCLVAVPPDIRGPFRVGFLNSLARALSDPNETTSPRQSLADLGTIIPGLVRDTLLGIAENRRMLRISGRNHRACRSLDSVMDLAGTILPDAPGLCLEAAEVADLIPGQSQAARSARAELRALRPLHIRLVAVLADPVATEPAQDA